MKPSVACPPAKVNFQAQHSDESFVLYTRQHWIRLWYPLLKLLSWNAFVLVIGYTIFIRVGIGDAFARGMLFTIMGFFFIFSHLEFLERFYNHFLYIIVITDKRIHRIKKKLLTTDDHQSVDLWMLQDVHKCQHGVIQNLLGYGTLILEAQNTVLRLHFLPRVGRKHRELSHLREQARALARPHIPGQSR